MKHRLIAAVGSGGKTTTLRKIAGHTKDKAILFTTTTHIYPISPPESRELLIDPSASQLAQALSQPGIICAGGLQESGKLGGLSQEALQQGLKTADLVLYEADGSRRLPLKLHRPGEPVMLPDTDCCIVVAGLSALGQPVGKVVHRYERNPIWKDAPDTPVGAEEFCLCLWDSIRTTQLPLSKIKVLLNQKDSVPEETALAFVRRLQGEGVDCRCESVGLDDSFLVEWLEL